MIAIGTFDNFNMAVSGVRGSIAAGLTLIYNTLMADALDEVSTEYGLLAEAVQPSAGFLLGVTYRLRAEARWHDGKPVTVEDVIFSLEVVQEASSAIRRLLPARDQGREDRRARGHVHLRRARQPRTAADRRPALRPAEALVGRHRRLRQQARHRRRPRSSRRSAAAPTAIKSFVAGRTVVYERVKDYWGKDLNVNVGRDNFDEIRYEYFRDTTVALEAFKGDSIDWRTENSALNWATRYDFPARTEKRVLLEEFPIRSRGVMQAFVFNTRRAKFSDPRVRRAFNYAFDFEEMNKQLFFGQYTRIASYFEGTELASRGPAGRRGARDPGDRARQGAGRGVHHALHQSGRRQSGERARQPARRRAALARGRLGDPRPPAGVASRPTSR